MVTSELIAKLADTTTLTKAEAQRMIETVFAQIADELARGATIDIRQFGRFRTWNQANASGQIPYFKPGLPLYRVLAPLCPTILPEAFRKNLRRGFPKQEKRLPMSDSTQPSDP